MPHLMSTEGISIEEAPLTDVDVLKSDDVKKNVYRDPKSAIAFYVNLMASIVFGIMCAITCDWSKIRFKDEDLSKTEKYEAIGLAIFCLVVAVGLSYASLWVAAHYTKCMLYTGGILMVMMIIVLSVVSGSVLMIIFGVIFAVVYCLLLRQKDSIEFAIWVVQLSCRVLLEHRAMMHLAFLWLILQAIVCVGYIVFAYAGSIKYGTVAVIYLGFSFYWAAEVLSNVLVVTVSSLAAFWSTGGSVWDPEKPVRTSFIFATTYAFGSVCLGSLIVAVLKTIRLIARTITSYQERGDNDRWRGDNDLFRFINCICICFLSMLEGIIQYFNEWAYAYIAMYRNDFCTSAKMVWDLWKKNGWEVVCNDTFTDMVLFLPPLVTGLVVCGIFFLAAMFIFHWDLNLVTGGTVAGFVIGLLLCNMVMRLIGTVQNVIFLSYLEKRNQFKLKHNAEVEALEEKFQARYPAVFMDQV